MKVLIVEDHPADLKLMGAVLRTSGHIVSEWITVEGVAAAIAADAPDIILLDLRLPGISGVAFVRQLKGAAPTRDIPIVAVTAYPQEFQRDKALAAGCDAYIVKPIDTRKLSNQLQYIADSKSGELPSP